MHNNLKNFIKKHNVSQSEIARILKISRPTVAKILNDEREIKISEAKILAETFETTIAEIFNQSEAIEIISSKQKTTLSTEKKSKDRISIPIKNLAKLKNAILYITQEIGALPNVGQTVIYKILYFCDMDYYEKYEEQLIGATYIKNHFGPTPREFSTIIEEMIKKGEIEEINTKYFKRNQKKYLPVKKPDLSIFSGRELQHIKDEINRLGRKTATELSDFSHKDVPWITASLGDDISYEAVFYRTPETSVRQYEDD